MIMFYVLVGFVIGLAFINLRDRIERWYIRQQNKGLIESRLLELNNGRKTDRLTVDKELLS